MRRAGRVIGVAQGVAVLRAADDDPVAIGTPVLDERLERVGAVVDIFGPIDRPYLAVSPDDAIATETLLESVLYVR